MTAFKTRTIAAVAACAALVGCQVGERTDVPQRFRLEATMTADGGAFKPLAAGESEQASAICAGLVVDIKQCEVAFEKAGVPIQIGRPPIAKGKLHIQGDWGWGVYIFSFANSGLYNAPGKLTGATFNFGRLEKGIRFTVRRGGGLHSKRDPRVIADKYPNSHEADMRRRNSKEFDKFVREYEETKIEATIHLKAIDLTGKTN